MTLKVLSSVPSPPAVVTADPWIPLSIVWEIDPAASPLYLFVQDSEQGYVELKVHPETGALLGVVLIDLPKPMSPSRTFPTATPQEEGGAVLDLALWPWKVTPDYREPERRDIDAELPLSLTSSRGEIAVWFGAQSIDRVLRAGDVLVGVSRDDELVAIKASGLGDHIA